MFDPWRFLLIKLSSSCEQFKTLWCHCNVHSGHPHHHPTLHFSAPCTKEVNLEAWDFLCQTYEPDLMIHPFHTNHTVTALIRGQIHVTKANFYHLYDHLHQLHQLPLTCYWGAYIITLRHLVLDFNPPRIVLCCVCTCKRKCMYQKKAIWTAWDSYMKCNWGLI